MNEDNVPNGTLPDLRPWPPACWERACWEPASWESA